MMTVMVLLVAFGCDSGIPEVNRQKISTEQVVRFAQEINKRDAIKPAIDSTIRTHFQLVGQVLSDDAVLSVFDKPKVLRRRVLVEYHDTVSVNGMLQTNCAYELGDCEVVIHLTLLPSSDADLTEHMRTAGTSSDVVRSEKSGDKDVFIRKGEKHMSGTVFGQRLLVSFSAWKPDGAAGSEFTMNEDRLWSVLQSVASRIQ